MFAAAVTPCKPHRSFPRRSTLLTSLPKTSPKSFMRRMSVPARRLSESFSPTFSNHFHAPSTLCQVKTNYRPMSPLAPVGLNLGLSPTFSFSPTFSNHHAPSTLSRVKTKDCPVSPLAPVGVNLGLGTDVELNKKVVSESVGEVAIPLPKQRRRRVGSKWVKQKIKSVLHLRSPV